MGKFKESLLKLPEYLLIVSVLFYWYSTGLLFNIIAIVLILILVLQIIFKNKILAFIISYVLIFASFYMILALFSELNDFETFNNDAKMLLFVGLTYFISTILIAVSLILKYSGK